MIAYRQCLLRRQRFEQTSWIPERYAIVGKVLKLKEEDVWEDGWVVVAVYGRCKENEMLDPYKTVKAHRRKTGDAERKE